MENKELKTYCTYKDNIKDKDGFVTSKFCDNLVEISKVQENNGNNIYCKEHQLIVDKINNQRKEQIIKEYEDNLLDWLGLVPEDNEDNCNCNAKYGEYHGQDCYTRLSLQRHLMKRIQDGYFRKFILGDNND